METPPARAMTVQLPHRATLPHRGGNRRGRHTSVTTDGRKEDFTHLDSYVYVEGYFFILMILSGMLGFRIWLTETDLVLL